MARIYVEFNALRQVGTDLKSISSRVNEIQSNFQQMIGKLDWEIRCQENINKTAVKLSNKLNNQAEALSKYHDFINEACAAYEKLNSEKMEEEIAGKINGTASIVESASNADDTNKTDNENTDESNILELVKAALNIQDKMELSDVAGVTGGGIEYLQALYEFFSGDMKGTSGARDWFNMGDKSIEVWSGLYDYLKNFYKETGDLFSVENQAKVAGLGIIGGTMGFISSSFGAADTIKNTEGIGAAGIIGESLSASEDIVDIGKDIYKIKKMGDEVESKIYSPSMKYATAMKGYISAISQGFKSYEKYSADGTWDLGDKAATGVEASVAGLYSMVDSLTFGLISEETTGVSAEQISTALEKMSENIGTKAGNYIINNPSLHEKYKKAGVLGKAAITFYSAFQ